MEDSDFQKEAISLAKAVNISLNLQGAKDTEALFYALAQVLHDRINSADLTQERKGEVLSGILAALIQYNREELAVYNETIRNMMNEKPATIH